MLIDFEIINNRNTELNEMNEKRWTKIRLDKNHCYPNVFILLLLGYVKLYFHLPYGQIKESIV